MGMKQLAAPVVAALAAQGVPAVLVVLVQNGMRHMVLAAAAAVLMEMDLTEEIMEQVVPAAAITTAEETAHKASSLSPTQQVRQQLMCRTSEQILFQRLLEVQVRMQHSPTPSRELMPALLAICVSVRIRMRLKTQE
jgi:hypothetical protein